jgi:hypothetical protein
VPKLFVASATLISIPATLIDKLSLLKNEYIFSFALKNIIRANTGQSRAASAFQNSTFSRSAIIGCSKKLQYCKSTRKWNFVKARSLEFGAAQLLGLKSVNRCIRHAIGCYMTALSARDKLDL